MPRAIDDRHDALRAAYDQTPTWPCETSGPGLTHEEAIRVGGVCRDCKQRPGDCRPPGAAQASSLTRELASFLRDEPPGTVLTCAYCGSQGPWHCVDRNRLPICDAWPACREPEAP